MERSAIEAFGVLGAHHQIDRRAAARRKNRRACARPDIGVEIEAAGVISPELD